MQCTNVPLSVTELVLAHDGQAARSRDACAGLGAASQQDLVKFVRSIGYDTE
jgi:CxxC motif-containing protein (DUF1111 family)